MKQQPHSEEAERGVLGSILIDSDRVINLCLMRPLTHESFYTPSHRMLYDSLLKMYEGNETVDLITVGETLRKNDRLDKTGGYAFLEGLIDGTPTSAHAEYYVDIVFAKHLARAGISAYEEGIHRLNADSEPTDAFMRVSGDIERLIKTGIKERDVDDVNKSIIESWDKKGLLSRHLEINIIMRYDGMVVLGGRPSCGKTAWILDETSYWCDVQKLCVCGASIEMTEEKIRERMAGSYAGVNTVKLWRGDATDEERTRMKETLEYMKDWNLHITDSTMTCAQFCSWAKSMKSLYNPDVIWIDYLQLLHCADDDWRIQPEQRIARWSNEIKSTQKEIGIPIIILSQLSRAGGEGIPQLGSLRYSGAIEQDADVVVFVYKDPDADESLFRGVEDWPEFIDIQKQRNGEINRVPVIFERRKQKFLMKKNVDILEPIADSSQRLEWD